MRKAILDSDMRGKVEAEDDLGLLKRCRKRQEDPQAETCGSTSPGKALQKHKSVTVSPPPRKESMLHSLPLHI